MSAPTPVPAEMAARREQRRKQVEDDGELSPLEKELLKSIHAHGDEMIDTFRGGFGTLERSTKTQTYVGMVMGFVLLLVLMVGALQIAGVDVGETADAVERLAPLATPTTTTTATTAATTETTTTATGELPAADPPPASPAPVDDSPPMPAAAPVAPPAGD